MFFSIDTHKQDIIKMATQAGMTFVFERTNPPMLRFAKDEVTIDVWYVKMTVAIHKHKEWIDVYCYEVSTDDLFEMMMSPLTYRHKGKLKLVENNRKKIK